MDITAYDALSFDCYGTLIDWEAGISAVLSPWARAQGLALSDEDLLTAYSGNEAAVEAESPFRLYPAVLAEAFRRTGADLGRPVGEADAATLAGSVPEWPAFPDSHEALERLHEHFQLVILSNIDRQSFAGSAARLDVDFDLVITAEDLGSYKPDPANFEALLTRTADAGVGEGRLLHVAQSLFHDHVQAKAVGLPTVWINRRHDRPGWGATPDPGAAVTPDWEFPSMAAFADAVDAASARPTA